MGQVISVYCVKIARIVRFSGPYFPAFGLNTNTPNSDNSRAVVPPGVYEPAITYSLLTIKTLEQRVEYVQS